MKYVLKGRVVTVDAASTVLQAGAVYIDGQKSLQFRTVPLLLRPALPGPPQ
jgi:hypothetical protein